MTVTELQKSLRVTQGAISQTVKLMESDGLICRISVEDRRSQRIQLTSKGIDLRDKLLHQWALRLSAIDKLEAEIGEELRKHLLCAIKCLESNSFDKRIKQQSTPQ